MLSRTILIVAILAGLGSAGVAYYQFSVQIPALAHQRDAEKTEKVREVAAHNETKAQLQKTVTALKVSNQELADTTLVEQKTLVRADAQEKRANALQGKVDTMKSDLDYSQGLLAAYQYSGLKPDEVIKLKGNLVMSQKEVASVTEDRDAWKRRYLATNPGGVPGEVRLPADLKGSVAVVDPKWSFVVINVGEDQGALPNGELLVSRDGKLVAKVVIAKVQKDRCIANIVPGWKLGDIIEGDVVIPAEPDATLSMR